MLRCDQGYKQQHVARLLGISIPAYSKIETGATDLNYSRIVQIASLYQLTPAQLLDTAHDPFKKDDTLLLKSLEGQLAKKEQQLSELQDKLIGLYGQLHLKNYKATG